jgi:hypothetical protein
MDGSLDDLSPGTVPLLELLSSSAKSFRAHPLTSSSAASTNIV